MGDGSIATLYPMSNYFHCSASSPRKSKIPLPRQKCKHLSFLTLVASANPIKIYKNYFWISGSFIQFQSYKKNIILFFNFRVNFLKLHHVILISSYPTYRSTPPPTLPYNKTRQEVDILRISMDPIHRPKQ